MISSITTTDKGVLMKRIFIYIVALFILIAPGCSSLDKNEYKRYSDSIFDTFDTLVRVVAYTRSDEEFRQYFDTIHSRLQELHILFDIYNEYEGINNIKTINDNAGIRPIRVEQEIIDLIIFSKEWSERTGGSVNIALGPVLKIWHTYREEALYNPENAALPPADLLTEALEYSDLDKVIVDLAQMTVYLPDRGMSLDVGAVAKGFALDLVASEIVDEGLLSAIISAGGNIRTIGKPLDQARERWGIGVQDPDASIVGGSEKLLDIIYLSTGSVDTSGDYQRYYMVGDKLVHHLIDPETMMPAEHYRAVTVVAANSGIADFMSTALFLIPFEASIALAKSIDNFEAMWIMPDGEVRTTAGMNKLLESHGATNQEINKVSEEPSS
jgi:FAD:protein FMN transferase